MCNEIANFTMAIEWFSQNLVFGSGAYCSEWVVPFFCVESNTNNTLETAAENVKRNSQKVISKTANQKPN